MYQLIKDIESEIIDYREEEYTWLRELNDEKAKSKDHQDANYIIVCSEHIAEFRGSINALESVLDRLKKL